MLLPDIATYLAGAGIGVNVAPTTPWPIYLGGEAPSNTDNIIVLAERPGPPPETEMGHTISALACENPLLVVSVRALAYDTARTMANTLWTTFFRSITNVTLASGTLYLLADPKNSPFAIGHDENNRWMIGFDCVVSKQFG